LPDLPLTTLDLKDCAFTLQMGGVGPAHNLAELVERLQECPADCLYHHFCHPVLHRASLDSEFPNDLSAWADRELHDPVLAERLSMINPYALDNIEELRSRTLAVVRRRIDENVRSTRESAVHSFRFIRAVTVVFPAGVQLHSAADLMRALGEIGDHSLYYHFFEARMANGHGRDDFSAWLGRLPDTSDTLLQSILDIDFYYLTLDEVRQRLLQILGGR
jgi:hypothetical protein